jgi:hypothetical protein
MNIIINDHFVSLTNKRLIPERQAKGLVRKSPENLKMGLLSDLVRSPRK